MNTTSLNLDLTNIAFTNIASTNIVSTIKHICLLSCLLLSCNAYSDQHTHDGNHSHNKNTKLYSTQKISNSLTLLFKKGGNILLSKGQDGLLIIDNGYADLSNELKTSIDNIGGEQSLQYIINTHWHGDHTGANELLGKQATIIAHDNVRKRLSSPQEIPLFKMVSKAYPPHALPSLTYPTSMNIHFNGDQLQLKHYPKGHTDGDTVVLFSEANVIHMGDLFFHPMFPFIDTQNGGNALHYLENIQAINKTIDSKTVVIPGHGPISNKQGLSDFEKMLNGTIKEVTTLKNSGLDLSAAQQQGLSKQWKKWGNGFINEKTWIGIIYDSL